jgi:hypothetical protein
VTVEKTPTRVVMYMRFTAERDAEPVAEFRWSPESGVKLVPPEAAEDVVIGELMTYGVESFSNGRYVKPEEGPVFMRALLEPTRLNCGFVDESDKE